MDAETCNQLAWRYLQAGETQLALEHALRAHELKKSDLDYLNTLGVAYGEAGRLDLAEATFRRLLKRKPGFVDGLVNLAKALEKQERLEEASRHYERALAIQPSFPKLAVNLAKVYRERGDAKRARALLERSRATIEPEDWAVSVMDCDCDLGDVDGALARFRQEVAQHPEWKIARSGLALWLLATQQWRDGWSEYLLRRELLDPQAKPDATLLPPRLEDQRILLRGEQGIGDVLFYLRFAPMLRARGATIVLACEKKLLPLLRPNDVLEAVQGSGANDGALQGFDRAIWTTDLPALLRSTETPPAWRIDLDESDRAAAHKRLAQLGAPPYLAVTWRAGTDTARAREFRDISERMAITKSVPPKALGEALRGWRGTTLLVQRGARADDAAQFAAGFAAPFHDLSALGDDLRALLAVLSLVDEYVGVSNTNMHMLAGIGRSARVIVPYPPEWRWLRRADRSPWFPDFPVYRQPVSRDWSAPLAALRKDIGL